MVNNSTCLPEKIATIRNVAFHDDCLPTVLWESSYYVAIKPIAERLGLSWGSQSEKLNNERYSAIRIPCGTAGGVQNTLCIPLQKINGWLFSINPNKVRPDLKDKLIRYQEECFDALYQYWHTPREYPPIHNSPFDRIDHRIMYELRRVNPKLVQAYLMDRGITPDLVTNLLQDPIGLESNSQTDIPSLQTISAMVEQHGTPYDQDHAFLTRETFQHLMSGYNLTATLNHLLNLQLIWTENGRLTRKLSTPKAKSITNGQRKRVYVFSNKIREITA